MQKSHSKHVRKTSRPAKAFTIIEVMLATLILSITISGGMIYRYYSMLDAHRAEAKINAGRIGLLLLEGWRGTGGSSLYSPVDHIDSEILNVSGQDVTIYSSQTGVLPDGFTRLATTSFPDYRIALDEDNYYITLSYQDMDTDSDSINDLRLLNADVRWRRDFGEGTVTISDKCVRLTTCMGL